MAVGSSTAMKCLTVAPPSPDFLHLGTVSLAPGAGPLSEDFLLSELATEWKNLSAQLVRDPQQFHSACQRIASRSQDPSYTDDALEVFYQITKTGSGRIVVDFYI